MKDFLRGNGAWVGLAGVFIFSAALKGSLLKIGAPFITIDDITAYNGGFLVWFGNSPPQRMFLESWVYGLSSLATYLVHLVRAGQLETLGSNLVADAYRHFHHHPEPYVTSYRSLMLLVDLATAVLTWRLARLVLADRWRGWAAALVAALYLLSYNTVWCNVVARPDTLVTFFSTLGLYWYYKSEFGERSGFFQLSAVALGLAGGLKLHAVFFVVFITLDLLRVYGLRRAWSRIVPFGLIAVFLFLVGTGMLLFDPLRYIKLRMLNVVDDASPWIQWGEQILAALKGTGWVVLPLVGLGAWQAWRDRSDRRAGSVALLAVGWMILFLSIRQLRPYWMLPALPVFYLAAVLALTRMRREVAAGVATLLLLALGAQTVQVTRQLGQVPYTELKTWVTDNVAADAPMFIFGYEALDLPRNTACMARVRAGLEREMAADIQAGTPFVERHLKNWEETSRLTLFDLLNNTSDQGYDYYSYYLTPLDKFTGLLDMDAMQYLLVMEGFESPDDFPLQDYLAAHFTLRTTVTGNGGGGFGLTYRIYERRPQS